MLFSYFNGYRVILIELSRYGLSLRQITFLLRIRDHIYLSGVLRGARVQDTWADMTWKTLFPDTSVWMNQSMVRAGYECLRTWMFIRGLLLNCTLIVTCCMNCTDYGNNWSWNLSVWCHGSYILKLPVLIVAIRKLFWWHIPFWDDVVLVGKLREHFFNCVGEMSIFCGQRFEFWMWRYMHATEMVS